MHKADKELSEVAARWEEIKKGTSQVQRESIMHLQHLCFSFGLVDRYCMGCGCTLVGMCDFPKPHLLYLLMTSSYRFETVMQSFVLQQSFASVLLTRPTHCLPHCL